MQLQMHVEDWVLGKTNINAPTLTYFNRGLQVGIQCNLN